MGSSFFYKYVLLTEILLHHLVAELKNSIDEARSINEELQKQYTSLQETLKKVETEKMVGGMCLWLYVILLLL
jgi:thiamine kinase-like enzyme